MEGFTQNILLQNPHEWSVRWARLQLGSVFRRGTPPGGTAGWLGRGGRSSPTTFSSTSFKNTYSELEQWVCCACGVSR